MMNLLYLSST